MNADLSKDLLASHGLLNYLHASVQGRWAFFNVLDQVNSKLFEDREIAATRDMIERINTWLLDLYRGSPLISSSWTQPETFDAIKSIDYLKALKKEIVGIAQGTSQLLSSGSIAPKSEDEKLLVASFARYAYARDSYVRGFIEYGLVSRNEEMVRTYEQFIPNSAEDLEVARFLIQGEISETPPDDHNSLLIFRARTIPGVFRTHAHDMNQILAAFSGGFSFLSADFSPNEATMWNQAGIGPVAAGYWRAYDFSPSEASQWIAVGVMEAGSAVEWARLGFSLQSAFPWVQAGFPPALARKWRDAGFGPDRALPLVQQGFETPDSLPKAQEDQSEEEG